MYKLLLIFIFSTQLISCGFIQTGVAYFAIDGYLVEEIDTLTYYQTAKNKVINLLRENDPKKEALIKKKQNFSDKYKEYDDVKKWFQTSNLEFLEKDTINFYKIVKAETTYKKQTTISYLITPKKGIKYCYFKDDYIYFIEFSYVDNIIKYSGIERLSRGLRFEDFEVLTFNNDGKFETIVNKKDDYRYTVTKNDQGFYEVTYKNMLWEIIGNNKLETTLTIDSPQYESNWTDSKIFDYASDFFWLIFI